MSAVGTRQEAEPARGASYWRGEQHLIATAPAWTILRMNFYAELSCSWRRRRWARAC